MSVVTASVSVNGVRSPVLQSGDLEDSEAVVFVHGNPGHGEHWHDLLDRTGDFARGVAPDMPGFGDADKPADFSYTVEGYATHLDGVLHELGVRRAHLVLHDFGGPWGLVWGLQNSKAVGSVTLINTGVLLDYKWHRLAKIWRTPGLGEVFQATTTRPAFRMLIGHDNPRLLPRDIEGLYDISRSRSTKRAVLKLYRATPASAFERLQDAAQALDPPTLVVWGTTDAYIPWQQAERQRESFPSARIELLEGLGHWPFLEDPVRVAEAVIPFLRERVTAKG
jgi:pimeloyl-ACP methyl ester carboxylesterase